MKTRVNGVINEEFNIGSWTLTLKQKDDGIDLMNHLINDMKKKIPSVEVLKIYEGSFGGEIMPIFEGKIDSRLINNQNYKGEYLIMTLLPIPKYNTEITVPVISFFGKW